MEDIELDKCIVYMNSTNMTFLTTNFDGTFELTDPIRNAVYIKLLKTEVVLNPTIAINGNAIQDTDPIYVYFKKYKRFSTTIIKNNLQEQIKCFEYIPLNIGSSPANAFTSYKVEYTSTGCGVDDINTYILNPYEPNLKKFDIQLYDKNNVIIPKSSIKSFNMLLCIYSARKKISMI